MLARRQSRGHLTAEKSTQDQDIALRTERSSINGHLDPESGAIQLHPAAVGHPFHSRDHRSEFRGGLVDGALEAPAGFVQTLIMLKRQVDQRHAFTLPRRDRRVLRA